MLHELLGLALILALTFGAAWLLGRYLVKVYQGMPVWTDFLAPLERLLYRLTGVRPEQQMNWKQAVSALLLTNAVWLAYAWLALCLQDRIPLMNPDHIPGMTWHQGFNTAVSFVTNTNLQHYSGETGASYFSQIFVLQFLQFVSAASGIAALIMILNGLREAQTRSLGNFYAYFVRSVTRVLLPLSIAAALLLLIGGTPMTFAGAAESYTLEGDTIRIARGPVAGMVAVKQLGTNGGGYFGPNSTHPFENPSYFTNVVENVSILLIPIALVFAMGGLLRQPGFSRVVMAVMTGIFTVFLGLTVWAELSGSPWIADAGISQPSGSLEGKEMRFGAAASALWGVSTTATSNGSVNAMHDSLTPLSGGILMLDMMINALYGGVGVGLINMLVFVIIAVFLSGLMVGRSPEFFEKKLESREIRIAALVMLLHPFLILGGTALACWIYLTQGGNEALAWLNNPGFHGFSEILYEFTSASANNGSGFEGLGDNTPFWNVSTGLVMLLGRYVPVIGPLAIAGMLAGKRISPPSPGAFRTDTAVFGIILTSVILIVAALSFFPALALGPVAEFLTR
ncbi:MAG: potassium-transporting ATPase subunit KdpA [Bacteroidia bacterium]|nr:potassium-transporting ATPase subunit KdpA [Bacteroidia bacterium]